VQAALKPLRIVKSQPAGELETLFQTHHGRVFRTAQRITGSAADAEDVLQTVFLRLVKPRKLTISRAIRKITSPARPSTLHSTCCAAVPARSQ